jgi:hypothetical protein
VGRVAFDAKFNLLKAALAQNQFGNVAVLNVAEKPVLKPVLQVAR